SIAVYYEVAPHLVFRCVVSDFWGCYKEDEEDPEEDPAYYPADIGDDDEEDEDLRRTLPTILLT
ncbi:hypothetical protein Tco_0647304, partial [Tanacetum coccineum]